MSDAATLFCLLESAAGYGLFEVVAMDEIASLTSESAATMSDLKRFGRAVKLKSFLGFDSAATALDNANAISEHAMSDTLRNFLEVNLPKSRSGAAAKSGKTPAFSLGVIDPALATAISSGLGGVSCRSDDTVREVMRGCRLHLSTFVKGLSNGNDKKAQLGLGHSYSRSKVKFNPARSDNMIIQSIALLDQLDKDVNTFAMRVREWYSWHFPELKDVVKDNIMFARTAAYIQDKGTLLSLDPSNNKVEGLVEILGGDRDMAHAVVSAAKTSMGMDCSDVDMINIVNFTTRMVKLAEYRRQLSKYLSDKMNVVAPNLSALIGDTVAARLISKAGSLTNLAKSPASTVQILGAEKALFRALKSKGNTPKYGLIYHSTFIGRADAKNKGRISRYLANKCSIATRIDSFGDEPTRVYGDMLREQVEERLRFYETGQSPRKNLDVMHEAAKQVKGTTDAAAPTDSADAPSSKKKKKRMDDDDKDEEAHDHDSDADDEKKKKKHKKQKKHKKDAMDVDSPSPEKKRKSKGGADVGDDDADEADKSAKKKKKRKSKGGD